jgi:hypothetical protein
MHLAHLLATRSRDQAALQHRVNDGVYVLITPLKQEGEAVLNGKLQGLQEIRVMEGLDL